MNTSAPHPRRTNEELYAQQVKMLRQFLQNGAISQAQYDKSYGDLTAKMRFSEPHPEDRPE